ncbi:MAG: alpha/beta fold hydrolase [Deltaproteobacteria bacterium]|nr:MAG: alpha/beta fold hydrolase [Deltaproteobacteria bacterium]
MSPRSSRAGSSSHRSTRPPGRSRTLRTMTDFASAAIGDLALRHGGLLRDAQLAYVTYGLPTHCFTSSHRFAEGTAAAEGSWAPLVGPGRAIDTDRYFVVSSNMLGSSYGSTAPRSIDPATGRPYGPDFPRITLGDIVTAQRRLLDQLGVPQLLAVVGPSYGGFQAFAWGVEFPDLVRAIVPVTTAPRTVGAIPVDAMRARLAADPAWNGGRYAPGAMVDTMTALREDTLRRYGMDAILAERYPAADDRARALRLLARTWAEAFDPHSLLVLGAAANELDATADFARLRARVLFVLSTSDALFPPSLAPAVMAALARAGVAASYHELDSPYGHLAPGADAARWAPVLGCFLAAVAAQ